LEPEVVRVEALCPSRPDGSRRAGVGHCSLDAAVDPRTRSPKSVAIAFYRAVTGSPRPDDHADVSGLVCPGKKIILSNYISLSRSVQRHTLTATAWQTSPSDWHVSLDDRSDGGSSSTTVVYDVARRHGRYLVCGQLSA
jgi:hypothetical protein